MSDLNELATALAAAQGEMNNATFNRTNPHFKSKYADLAAIREATLPALTAHDLAIVQFTSVNDTPEIILHTRLIHKSGQFIESAYPIPRGSAQQMGSSMTYARRYSWSAMCGIASDDDDDGNAAEGMATKKTSAQAKRDGDFETFKERVNAAQSVSDLMDVRDAIRKAGLPDSWREPLLEVYEWRMAELKENHPLAKDSKVKQQLKESLEAEKT